MPIGRFFGRGRDDKPATPSDDQVKDTAIEAVNDPEMAVGNKIEPEAAPDTQWRERAEKWIPNGASTGSKRADKLYGEAHPDLPTHFTMARGAVLTDMHGAEYLDCGMALGAVALGYAEPRVTAAVIEAA